LQKEQNNHAKRRGTGKRKKKSPEENPPGSISTISDYYSPKIRLRFAVLDPRRWSKPPRLGLAAT
jgi:hypothetical protein